MFTLIQPFLLPIFTALLTSFFTFLIANYNNKKSIEKIIKDLSIKEKFKHHKVLCDVIKDLNMIAEYSEKPFFIAYADKESVFNLKEKFFYLKQHHLYFNKNVIEIINKLDSFCDKILSNQEEPLKLSTNSYENIYDLRLKLEDYYSDYIAI